MNSIVQNLKRTGRYQRFRFARSILKDPEARREIRRSLRISLTGKGPSGKVFAIGLCKSGTSSIHSVFTQLGYRAVHSNSWCRPGHALEQFSYQAFSDGTALNFPALDRRFPGSKFILNVRDLLPWLDSRLCHIHTQIATNEPYNPIYGWDITDEAIAQSVKLRNSHNLAVLEYFAARPDDLLVVNFIRSSDAATRIARFLGHQTEPDKPHVHPIQSRRDPSKIRHLEQISSVLENLNIPESDWYNDIYCPSLLDDGDSVKFPSDTRRLFGSEE